MHHRPSIPETHSLSVRYLSESELGNERRGGARRIAILVASKKKKQSLYYTPPWLSSRSRNSSTATANLNKPFAVQTVGKRISPEIFVAKSSRPVTIHTRAIRVFFLLPAIHIAACRFDVRWEVGITALAFSVCEREGSQWPPTRPSKPSRAEVEIPPLGQRWVTCMCVCRSEPASNRFTTWHGYYYCCNHADKTGMSSQRN